MLLRKLFTYAALSLSLVAMAVQPTKNFNCGNIYYSLPEFGYDGKSSFFLTSDDNCFTRVNEDLEPVETFNLSEQCLTIKKTIFLPSGFKYGDYYPRTESYDPKSLSEALQLIRTIYPQGYVTVDMDAQYHGEDDRKILFISGNKIPEKVFEGMTDEYLHILASEGSLDGIDGYAVFQTWEDSWVGAHTLYVYTRAEYNTGELDWSTELKAVSTNNVDWSYTYFDDVYYNDEMHDCIANITQTLFDSDEDYEILVPILKESKKSITNDVSSDHNRIEYTYEGRYGEETGYTSTWKEEVYPVEYTGVGVAKLRTGEISTIFEFPTPYINCGNYGGNFYLSDPEIFILGEKRYLQVGVPQNEDTYEYDYYIYDIDGAQSGVKTPVVAKKVRVNPTIVNRGEDVMVNVEGNDEISAITLTGMNGQTLQHIKGNGAKSAAVKTGRLGSGVHIVGVQTADGENTYNKIVVK